MTDTPKIDWPGLSGKSYTYFIYKLPPNFGAKPGNYIFTKVNSKNEWEPIYIGETGDLSERFDNHHAMPCIKRNEATHIHVHASSSVDQTRRNEESDLVDNFNPTCNK